MVRAIDITGKRFGRLIAVQRHGAKWTFKCDCGSEKIAYTANVTRGLTTSCGCVHREMMAARATHGLQRQNAPRSRELAAYAHAKARCFNPNDHAYDRYGGRGITMCERWRNDPLAFLADMGSAPDRYTLERKDVNGPYSPENCKWATYVEQGNNKRNNRKIDGKTLRQWAVETGIPHRTLVGRWKRGVPKDAMFLPHSGSGPKPRA